MPGDNSMGRSEMTTYPISLWLSRPPPYIDGVMVLDARRDKRIIYSDFPYGVGQVPTYLMVGQDVRCQKPSNPDLKTSSTGDTTISQGLSP